MAVGAQRLEVFGLVAPTPPQRDAMVDLVGGLEYRIAVGTLPPLRRGHAFLHALRHTPQPWLCRELLHRALQCDTGVGALGQLRAQVRDLYACLVQLVALREAVRAERSTGSEALSRPAWALEARLQGHWYLHGGCDKQHVTTDAVYSQIVLTPRRRPLSQHHEDEHQQVVPSRKEVAYEAQECDVAHVHTLVCGAVACEL